MSWEKNYYELLEVNRLASPADIKKAYKNLSKIYNSDINHYYLDLELFRIEYKFVKPRPWRAKILSPSMDFKEKMLNLTLITRRLECIKGSSLLTWKKSPTKLSKKSYKIRKFPFLVRNVHESLLGWEKYQTKLKKWTTTSRTPRQVLSSLSKIFDDKQDIEENDSANESVDLQHILECSNNPNSITPPPTIEMPRFRKICKKNSKNSIGSKNVPKQFSRKSKKSSDDMILDCICKENSMDMFLIQCFSCEIYQHGDCVGFEVSESPSSSRFVCKKCNDKSKKSISSTSTDEIGLLNNIELTPNSQTSSRRSNVKNDLTMLSSSKTQRTKKKNSKELKSPKTISYEMQSYSKDDAVGEDENGDPLWEVEDVLDAKGKGKKKMYYIKWKGYTVEESTWEPANSLKYASDLIENFHKKAKSNNR